MRVKYIFLFLVFLSISTLSAQNQNIRLIAHINDHAEAGYSDCWGYTAPNGDEFALLGVNNGISVIDVSDTDSVREIAFFPSANADWQDLKTYRHYAYITNDIAGTLDILDLANAPEEVIRVRTMQLQNFHNLYIDTTTALMYLANAVGEVQIYSLADPENPLYVSEFGIESHDVFVRDSVAYVAEGTQRSIGIFDVSNPAGPSLITRLNFPGGGYVHQVWVSEDNTLMVTTEETVHKTVKIWNIQDMNNIELLSEYLGENNLAHNAYIHGSFIYISHYESGLKLLDISNPAHVTEIGFYDTYSDGENPEYNGAWGVYPFTQNGMIFVSDIQTGLYVLRFEQEQGPQIVAPAIDFKNVHTGASSDTLPLGIKNFGMEVLTVTDISEINDPFRLTNLPEFPLILPPGQSVAARLVFTPRREGSALATVNITSDDTNDPVYEVQLKGYGLVINKAGTGVFYAGTGYPDPAEFLQIDAATGSGTFIGKTGIINPDFGFAEEITGLAINSKGEMFCSVWRGSDIYRIDSHSGIAVSVATTNLEIISIAFDRSDVLHARSSGSSHLYTVDDSTGNTKDLGNTGLYFTGMAFDPLDGDLWVSTWPDAIHKINTATLSSTFIGSTGFGTWVPSILFDMQGNLFGVKGQYETSDLIAISRVNGAGNIIGSTGYSTVYALAAFIPHERVLSTNEQEDTDLPAEFSLSQNSPNPFNPRTRIRYQVPVTSDVELSIYNLLGQKVETVIRGQQLAGTYEVDWDASRFSSGIYYYQFFASGADRKFMQTKKLILLK